MEKRRLLYVTFDVVPSPKGASTHIISFLEALKMFSEDVTLLTLGSKPGIEEALLGGVRHLRVGFEEPHLFKRIELFRCYLDSHLKKGFYDVVHFRSIWEGLTVLRLKAELGYKTLYEVNGLPSIELKYHYPNLASQAALIEKLKRTEVWALRQSDCIITPSGVTAELIKSASVEESRIHIIPNGVDISVFYPEEQARSSPTLSLLYTGTLAPWQGIGTLIAAMMIIKKDLHVHLVILGSGKKQWNRECRKLIEKAQLEKQITRLPSVPHKEVAGYIRKADICIAPLALCDRNTIQGCSPIKIFEYMACRKAVVASRIAAVEEILTHRLDSLLFTADDPESLAEAVLTAWHDRSLRFQLEEKAYQKVISHYCWNHARAKLLEVYREVMSA